MPGCWRWVMDSTRVRRRRLLIIVVTLVAVALVATGVYFFVPATGFSSGTLHSSVAREADRGTWPTGCERHAKGGWSCWVTTNGSDEIIYRVEMDGSRCWHGRRVWGGGADPPPKELDGCIKLRDQIRLFDRLLGL